MSSSPYAESDPFQWTLEDQELHNNYLASLSEEELAAYSSAEEKGYPAGLLVGAYAVAEVSAQKDVIITQKDAEIAAKDTTIEENEARIAELDYEATHNPVSNMLNERGFRRRFAELKEQSPDTPLAMIAIDLASFKAVNDRLMHHRGDELLRMVGRGLRGQTDIEGIVANPHGDEYIICTPLQAREDTTLTNEERLAAIMLRLEKLAEYMRQVFPELAELSFDITAGGIVMDKDMGLQEALEKADEKMYEVKEASLAELSTEQLAEIERLEAGYARLAQLGLPERQVQKYLSSRKPRS